MLPTVRALELEPEVRRILRDIDRLVCDAPIFSPALCRRRFTLRLSDLLSYLLLPELAARLAADAPNVALEINHLSPEATVDALERNVVELAVSTALDIPKSVERTRLFRDRIVVVVRKGHPALRQLSSLDRFLAVPQIKVAQSPIDDRFADRELAARGRQRRVVMTFPNWLALPQVIARTDFLAVAPCSIAERFAGIGETITLLAPPFADAFEWHMYWHQRQASDPAITWLRELIRETALPLDKPGKSGGHR